MHQVDPDWPWWPMLWNQSCWKGKESQRQKPKGRIKRKGRSPTWVSRHEILKVESLGLKDRSIFRKPPSSRGSQQWFRPRSSDRDNQGHKTNHRFKLTIVLCLKIWNRCKPCEKHVQPKRNCVRARNSFAAIINPKREVPSKFFPAFTHLVWVYW